MHSSYRIAAACLLLSVAAFALFGVLIVHGDWWVAVGGPVCLWWGGVLLAVAVSLAVAPVSSWPRDWRGRYLIGAIALAVGLWINLARVPWPALAVLPAYSTLEHILARRLFAVSASSKYMRLSVWVEIIVVSEVLGYLMGVYLSGEIR